MFLDLTDEWHGWRIRGGVLISPEGDRVTPRRLDGLLFVESLRLRYAKKPVRQCADVGSGLASNVTRLRGK